MKKQIFFIPVCLMLFACGNQQNADDNKAESHDSLAVDTVHVNALIEEVADNDVNLPSPMRIAANFKRSGLKFIESSLNPLDNSKLYTSNFSSSLNLGIYSADLAYCLLNKQQSLAKNYLQASKNLGAQLGLNSAFESNNLAQRFEKNMGKDDSLMALVTELQLQTDLVLEQSKQTYISGLIFTGALLETLHSATQVYKQGEEKMASVVLEQVQLIGDVVKVLSLHKEKDPAILGLIADLENINKEFKAIEGLKDVDLAEIDFSTLMLKQKALLPLCEKIESLRNKIIKG